MTLFVFFAQFLKCAKHTLRHHTITCPPHCTKTTTPAPPLIRQLCLCCTFSPRGGIDALGHQAVMYLFTLFFGALQLTPWRGAHNLLLRRRRCVRRCESHSWALLFACSPPNLVCPCLRSHVHLHVDCGGQDSR